MEWDEYTIKVKKRRKPDHNQKFEIISVTMNGQKLKETNDDIRPNFKDDNPPTERTDCIYVGGTEDNRCRWVFGKWF